MLLPILLALALQSPPEVAPQSAPASEVIAQPLAPVKPAAAPVSDTPHGAPADDFGFVSWCRGALSGHMELYVAVKPELQRVEAEKADREDARYTTDAQREAAVKRRTKEALDDTKLDEEQLAAGRTYLTLYTDAITAAEGASADNLRARSEEAQDAGYRIWAAARGAEPRTKMWSWVMWELPARCETAAHRLIDRSSLLAGALRPQAQARAEVSAPVESAKPVEADTAPAADAITLTAPKPAEEVAAEPPKPDTAPPAADRPVETSETKPAHAPKAADALPPEEPPATRIEPGAPAPADGPVTRRPSTAPPSDAPDAPRPDPKPEGLLP